MQEAYRVPRLKMQIIELFSSLSQIEWYRQPYDISFSTMGSVVSKRNSYDEKYKEIEWITSKYPNLSRKLKESLLSYLGQKLEEQIVTFHI